MKRLLRIMMLLAAMIITAGQPAWAKDITINLGEGRGTVTFSEASLEFSKCEALEVGFSFDIPLEVMTQSKTYGGVVMQNYTAKLDNGMTIDGTLTGEIVAGTSQTYTYTVTSNEMTKRPVSVSTALTRSDDSGIVEIATWSGFRKGACSFTFDDGAPSHVSDAGPVFKKYGYKATFNLVVNWNPDWSGFQGLADEGHEIASHSNTHGQNMSGEEASSKQAIAGKIQQKYGIITVAYPNCNVPNKSAVQQNYVIGRICNGSWQSQPDMMGKDGPSDWTMASAIMTGSTGTNDFKGNMQKAVQQGGWIAFLTHGIENKNNGSATYSPTPLSAIEDGLKWAQQNDKDIWVAPMGHVAMYIKERKASEVEITASTASSMTIQLTHTIADNISDYDYPLSLRVKSNWEKVEVTQGNNVLESKIDGGYIYFDAIPNDGDIVVINEDASKINYEHHAGDGGLLICYDNADDASADNWGNTIKCVQDANNHDKYTYYPINATLTGGIVYIVAQPDFGYTGLGATITAEKTIGSGEAQARRRATGNDNPGISQTIAVTAVSGHPGVYQFTMPTDGSNVTLSAKFNTLSTNTAAIDYLDEKGASKTKDKGTVYVLDGTDYNLGVANEETWYVANGELAYSHTLSLYGDVHLILADGAQMTVTRDNNYTAIYRGDPNIANTLSIYAQSTGSSMGSLSAKCSEPDGYVTNNGIEAGSITINGGNVSATGKCGLYASGGNGVTADVTINGGIVTARAMRDNCEAIYAFNKVTVNGGQVKAVIYDGDDEEPGTIHGYNGITLGWTTADDYILAGSYELGTTGSPTVSTADSKGFIAYEPADATGKEREAVIIGAKAGGRTLDAQCLAAIAGKVVRPAANGAAGVSYLDWDDTSKALVSRNTATDDIDANDIVYLLTGGGATILPGGWYAAKGEVAYTSQLQFTGDAHLILADGAEMTVVIPSNVSANAIYGNNASITIYGQGGEREGSLTTSHSNYCIYASSSDNTASVTINGGKVTANNVSSGIFANSASGTASITINGGQVEVTGTLRAIRAESKGGTAGITINGGQVEAAGNTYGIYASGHVSCITINGGQVKASGNLAEGIYAKSDTGSGTASVTINGGIVEATSTKSSGIQASSNSEGDTAGVTINGGQVEAAGSTYGINVANGNKYGTANITLGWTNVDDFIFATSYYVEGTNTVSINTGNRFIAYVPGTDSETNAVIPSQTGTEATGIIGSGTVSDLAAINGKTLRPLAVAETDNEGKVTTWPGYVVTTPAGLTLSGKTDQSGAPKPDFTITTGTGDAAVTTPYYIYKEGADVSLVTTDYGQTGVEISGTNVPATVTVSQDRTKATFAMPTEDVTLTDMKYYAEDVEYRDWNSTTKALEKKTADKAYILTGGGATTLPGGWYVVTNWNTATDNEGHSPDAAYTGQLQFTGATHLILADDAEMSVDTQGTGYAIYIYNSTLATLDIYGQAYGTGALTAKSDNNKAIYLYSENKNSDSTSSLTINGGKVSAIAGTNYNGIYVAAPYSTGSASITINGGEVAASGYSAINVASEAGNVSVTINGGQVEASGSSKGIYVRSANGTATATITGGKVTAKGVYNGIYASSTTSAPPTAITISGGQVEASGRSSGIYSDAGDIHLGWTNADDYIYASSYLVGSGKSVKTVAGQRFVAYNGATGTAASTIVSGANTDANATFTLDAIAGKTLKPLDGYFVSTADNNISLMNGTTAKTADFTISNTPYYIYKASTDVTMRYDAAFAELTGATVSPVEGEPMQRTFKMPADDVTLATTAVTGLTVSGTYTYDGTAQTPAIKKGDAAFAATNNYTMAFKQNSVDVSEAKNAGTYDVTLTGLGQYIGTATLTGAFTIGQKEVTISGITAESKTYDGTTSATISATNASVVGKVDGDNIGVDFTVATAVFADANAGENKPVTITGVTLVGSDANNYTLSEQPTGVKGTITRKTLTITADSDTKEFDGTPLTKGSYTHTELAEDDAIESVTITGSQTEVGSSDNVPSAAVIKNIAGNAVTNNYAITYANGTLEVIPAKITLFAENTTNLWATFCDENARTLPEGCTAYTISSVSGTTVNLSAALTTIPAYTPVLIKREANATLPILTTYQAKGTAPASGYDAQTGIVTFAATGGTVYGNAGKTAVTDSEANHFISDQTYVLFNGKFVKVGTNSGLAAHRLWLNVSSAAARELIIGDDATGIASMDDAGGQNADGWYSLDGRKLDKAPKKKGVYVNSGRKVVIK